MSQLVIITHTVLCVYLTNLFSQFSPLISLTHPPCPRGLGGIPLQQKDSLEDRERVRLNKKEKKRQRPDIDKQDCVCIHSRVILLLLMCNF